MLEDRPGQCAAAQVQFNVMLLPPKRSNKRHQNSYEFEMVHAFSHKNIIYDVMVSFKQKTND